MTPLHYARQFALLLLAGVLLAFAQLSLPFALAASPPSALYTAQDLGTFGRHNSTAFSVSNNGETVVNGGGLRERGFAWTTADSLLGVVPLSGGNWSFMDVSGNGSTVVGSTHVGENRRHAFLWTQAGGSRDLGTLGGGESYARGVSDDGNTVVGYSTTAEGVWRAFVWTEKRGMWSIGTLGGSRSYSHAFAVSGDGRTVVGESDTTDKKAER